MKKKILLTGASGAVGLETLKELINHQDEYDIRIFDRWSRKSQSILKPFQDKAEIVFGDLRNPSEVEKATKGINLLIHLGAIIPPFADENTELAEAVNVGGTNNLIRGLKLNGDNPFILYSSSISVYGDRLNTPWIKVGDPLIPSQGDYYATTKIKAERAVQDSGLPFSIFRFSGIMSPGLALSPLLFHMPLDTCFEMATTRDTAYALRKSIYKLAELNGEIFNLGGGETMRMKYSEYLKQHFSALGLNNLRFPSHAFAAQNFHCGFYEDTHILNDILDFQRDNPLSYFKWIEQSFHPIVRKTTQLVRPIVQNILLRYSDPYLAVKNKDQEHLDRYFPTEMHLELIRRVHGDYFVA